MPFLTVITRTMPGREKWLERNIESWRSQTDQDYEQIVITDSYKKWDMLRADRMLPDIADQVTGKYVYILDDDDYLIDKEFVAEVKKAAQQGHPEIIMVKMRRDAIFHDVLPKRWGQDPEQGDVGTPCFVVRTHVWKTHIWQFGQAINQGFGDFSFINNAFAFGSSVAWLDRVVACVDHIGAVDHKGVTKMFGPGDTPTVAEAQAAIQAAGDLAAAATEAIVAVDNAATGNDASNAQSGDGK